MQAFKDTDFEEDTKNVGGQIKDTEIDILAKIVQRSSFEKEECNDAPFDLINWPTFMKHNQQNEKYEKLISIVLNLIFFIYRKKYSYCIRIYYDYCIPII